MRIGRDPGRTGRDTGRASGKIGSPFSTRVSTQADAGMRGPLRAFNGFARTPHDWRESFTSRGGTRAFWSTFSTEGEVFAYVESIQNLKDLTDL